MLLEQVQGGKPYYYHADRLGSVRALTDNTGGVQDTYQYDAYGTTTSSTGSLANPFRYTGQYQDSESGLYYLRARYYDPATQQFLTRDPLANLTGTAYAYANGSPVNGVDPSGLQTGPPEENEPPPIPPTEEAWYAQVRVWAIRNGNFDGIRNLFDPRGIWSDAEWETAQYIMHQDQIELEPVPQGTSRGPDAKVVGCDQTIEMKGIESGTNSKGVAGRVGDSLGGGRQSPYIVVDTTSSEVMTANEAVRAMGRVRGLLREGTYHGLDRLRIYSKTYGYDLIYDVTADGVLDVKSGTWDFWSTAGR